MAAAEPGEPAPDEPPLECRICRGEGDATTLCSPCNCTGSMQYVHRHCLARWVLTGAASRCNVCLAQWSADVVKPPTASEFVTQGHLAGFLAECPALLLRHIFVDRCNRHVSCCLVRAAAWGIVGGLCMVQGRIMVWALSGLASLAMRADRWLDATLFPAWVVDWASGLFPPLQCFSGGPIETAAWGLTSLGEVRRSLVSAALRKHGGYNDLALMLCVLSLNVAYLRGAFPRHAHLFRPTLVVDLSDALRLMTPSAAWAVHWVLLAPSATYLIRWALDYFGALPAHAGRLSLATGEGVALHAVLLAAAAACMSGATVAAEAVENEFSNWRADVMEGDLRRMLEAAGEEFPDEEDDEDLRWDTAFDSDSETDDDSSIDVDFLDDMPDGLRGGVWGDSDSGSGSEDEDGDDDEDGDSASSGCDSGDDSGGSSTGGDEADDDAEDARGRHGRLRVGM